MFQLFGVLSVRVHTLRYVWASRKTIRLKNNGISTWKTTPLAVLLKAWKKKWKSALIKAKWITRLWLVKNLKGLSVWHLRNWEGSIIQGVGGSKRQWMEAPSLGWSRFNVDGEVGWELGILRSDNKVIPYSFLGSRYWQWRVVKILRGLVTDRDSKNAITWASNKWRVPWMLENMVREILNIITVVIIDLSHLFGVGFVNSTFPLILICNHVFW